MPDQAGVRAEGQVFGDVDSLRDAFAIGSCRLLLQNGEAVAAVLLGCSSDGAADIRITEPMTWP
jgi:hypothetical protein